MSKQSNNTTCDHLVAVRQEEGGMTSFYMSEVKGQTMKEVAGGDNNVDVFTYCPYCGVKIPYSVELSDDDCLERLAKKLNMSPDMLELIGTSTKGDYVTRSYQIAKTDGGISYYVETCGAKLLGITKHEVLE